MNENTIRPLYLDELPEKVQKLYKELKGIIQHERNVYKNPIREIRLHPTSFEHFKELMRHVNGHLEKNDTAPVSEDDYLFDGVHIRKGNFLQRYEMTKKKWAKGGNELERQRRELNMEHLNN